MFERFTRTARAVVVDARERALTDRSTEIGEEHLLAALLAAPHLQPVLDRLGLSGGEGASDVLDQLRAARPQCR